MNLTLDIVDDFTDLHLLFVKFNNPVVESIYRINNTGPYNFCKHKTSLRHKTEGSTVGFDVHFHNNSLQHQRVWLVSNHSYSTLQGNSLFSEGTIETKHQLIKSQKKYGHFFIFEDVNLLETFTKHLTSTFALLTSQVSIDKLPKKEQFQIFDYYDEQQD